MQNAGLYVPGFVCRLDTSSGILEDFAYAIHAYKEGVSGDSVSMRIQKFPLYFTFSNNAFLGVGIFVERGRMFSAFDFHGVVNLFRFCEGWTYSILYFASSLDLL